MVGGYIPNGDILDSLLVGYYESHQFIYAASVRAGIPLEFRRVPIPHLEALRISRCPFVDLPDRGEGRWGEGLTTAKMAECCWLHPFIVTRIEFLEWTPTIDCVTHDSLESAVTKMLATWFGNRA